MRSLQVTHIDLSTPDSRRRLPGAEAANRYARPGSHQAPGQQAAQQQALQQQAAGLLAVMQAVLLQAGLLHAAVQGVPQAVLQAAVMKAVLQHFNQQGQGKGQQQQQLPAPQQGPSAAGPRGTPGPHAGRKTRRCEHRPATSRAPRAPPARPQRTSPPADSVPPGLALPCLRHLERLSLVGGGLWHRSLRVDIVDDVGDGNGSRKVACWARRPAAPLLANELQLKELMPALSELRIRQRPCGWGLSLLVPQLRTLGLQASLLLGRMPAWRPLVPPPAGAPPPANALEELLQRMGPAWHQDGGAAASVGGEPSSGLLPQVCSTCGALGTAVESHNMPSVLGCSACCQRARGKSHAGPEPGGCVGRRRRPLHCFAVACLPPSDALPSEPIKREP